jgi:hypothetical protein
LNHASRVGLVTKPFGEFAHAGSEQHSLGALRAVWQGADGMLMGQYPGRQFERKELLADVGWRTLSTM